MIFKRVFLIALILFSGCGRKNSIIAAPEVANQSSVLRRELLEKIYSEHTAQLSHTQIEQKPFVITFSGVRGWVKSFIAEKLADQFKAVRIRSDDVRDMLKKVPGIDKKDKERAVKEYLFYMLRRYNFPNRRLVLDASIDRNYVALFPYFEKQNIPFIVIRLEVPREIIVERIMKREGASAPYYLNMLDTWFEDYEAFGNSYKNYFLFKNVPGASLDAIIDEIGHRKEIYRG